MDKNKVITEIYLSKEVEKLKSKLPNGHADDIIQHVFLTIFELPEAKVLDLINQNKLKAYILVCIWNASKMTKTNSFGRSVTKEFLVDSFNNITYDDEWFDLYQTYLGKESFTKHIANELADVTFDKPDVECLKWYHKELIEMYADYGSFNEISIQTKIPISSVRHAIIKARKQIKRYNDNLNKTVFR